MSTARSNPVRRQRLLDYIKDHVPQSDREAFAQRIGTTYPHLKQIAYGHRPCSPAYAVNIDRETAGAVTMQEMCPEIDWDHVYSAMRAGDVTVNWDQVKERIHRAVDTIDFGLKPPVKPVRRASREPVQAG
jgi:DNA-binding transcriptional regulator YdaS (Cro superfamily)